MVSKIPSGSSQLWLSGLVEKRPWSPLGVIVKETIGHRQGREEPQEKGRSGLFSALWEEVLRRLAVKLLPGVTGEGGQEGQCVLMQKQVGVRCCVGKGVQEPQDEGLEVSGFGLKELCYEIGELLGQRRAPTSN